mmetsp:Transcript_7501/g.13557  ORF Transcript_7501/g.13557 Transcript_7501/m.13557 type:complete len:459 (+) Transcript_7501:3-1379(+)
MLSPLNFSQPKVSDTVVMFNLGYFQLKAPTPGFWILQITGRGKDIFQIRHLYSAALEQEYDDRASEPIETKSDSHSQLLMVLSLDGATDLQLRVSRLPGKETSKLVEDASIESDGESIVEHQVSESGTSTSLTSVLSRARKAVAKTFTFSRRTQDGSAVGKRNADVVHVFSVASGHLYERFLRIMMLSASKSTSVPVKFWLLANYLSPLFKRTLPKFAAAHGFQYEYVNFQWPRWLRAQTEKQRIIWAYKILFLDVLFPLDLERVIFVDSDQVVRGDLHDLYTMDIGSAAYAYTPFCDSREEVEGYRFWKQGYWASALQGKPYHISALYLINLNRFRQMAAGDTLRVTYQRLSADPNSLSNLDQDLPNVLNQERGGVPIFSLPQEWLWCESWCSDESKTAAKTIDLCNNPMTKEPKLQSAQRIIPEWKSLDSEAQGTMMHIVEALTRSSTEQVEHDEL